MDKGRGGVNTTSLWSWHRAQQCPSIRSRIGPAVVEWSVIKLCERWGTYLYSQPPQGSTTSWVSLRQRRPLYPCVAGVEPNNLPQSDPGSEQSLMRDLSSGSGIASTPFSPVTSWIKIAEGWILHHCEAGIGPNNHPQSEPGSDKRSWRDPSSSSGSAGVPTYKVNPHKGQRLHEFRCDRDVLYTPL